MWLGDMHRLRTIYWKHGNNQALDALLKRRLKGEFGCAKMHRSHINILSIWRTLMMIHHSGGALRLGLFVFRNASATLFVCDKISHVCELWTLPETQHVHIAMCDIALYAFGFHINECHRTTLYAQPHTHDWRINARKEFEYSYLRAMPNQPTTNPLETNQIALNAKT